MKQVKYILLIIVASIVAITTACTPEMDIEEPTLNIPDVEALTFPAEGGDQKITVETNQNSWVAIAKGDWVETTRIDNTLVVKVGPYAGVSDRHTNLYIMAGGLTREIEVHQSSGGAVIVTSPEELEVWPWEADDYKFDVNVNTDNWEVEVDVNWIDATPRPWKKEVLFKVQDNPDRTPRTGTITVIAEKGKSSKAFSVTQMGSFYYLLPYLDFDNGNRVLIRRFEENRRSQLSWDYVKYFQFKTLSPLFTQVHYLIDESGLISATLPVKKADFTKEFVEGYAQYLLDKGFEKKTATTFFKEEGRISATIDPKETSMYSDPEVVFIHVPEQTKPYETFKELPLHFEEWGASIEAVKAYEAEIGGELFAIASELDGFDPEEEGLEIYYYRTKDNLLLERWYIFRQTETGKLGLASTQKNFSDMGLVYWTHRGEKYMTKEFKAFMDKEGFIYKGLDESAQKWDIFINAEEGMQLGFRVVQYEGAEIPHLVVMIGPYAKTGGSSFSLLDNHYRLAHTPYLGQ